MRSVHTECSTHHERLRVSAACLGWLSTVTIAARLLSSFVIDFTPSLSYVPWLHGRYPAPSLLRPSSLPRAGPRDARALNTVLVPTVPPVYLFHTSNPSVPNYPAP